MKRAQDMIFLVENPKHPADHIVQILKKQGYPLEISPSGDHAFSALLEHPNDYGTVILDYEAPHDGGLGLLAKISSASPLKIIPIVLIVPNEDPAVLETAIRVGARYCLAPGLKPQHIVKIIEAAIYDHQYHLELQSKDQINHNHSAAEYLHTAEFQIKNLYEAKLLSHFLSYAYPNPNLAVVGISELLINAIEHGNLRIAYDEKSHLKRNNAWDEAIEARLKLPEFRNKKVDIHFEKTDTEIKLQITDDGPGFNAKDYLENDSKRAFHLHGRGIMMAKKLIFPELIYSNKGNSVTCISPLEPGLTPKPRERRRH